jgi:hypothetical protein
MLYFAGTDECLDTGRDQDPIIFNLDDGCRRTRRQRPPGGLPLSSSSTLVVDTVGPAGSAL